ncbi:hypothetical protein [Brenneria tiliae]|uniref:E14 prophage n=1 Tax=Brenneria tiliae TaxID=2914984 RepID=A0ABT0MRQ8_9GAMM|nr:hypothetical protein [Brenneria tiliae]MCL2892482.1 hypothetical protein [Brenneria tiliae]
MFLTLLALIVGIIGAMLLSFGAWLLYPALGYMVAGGLCLYWSWLVSRSLAGFQSHSGEGGK